jgi:hypothetical protein
MGVLPARGAGTGCELGAMNMRRQRALRRRIRGRLHRAGLSGG